MTRKMSAHTEQVQVRKWNIMASWSHLSEQIPICQDVCPNTLNFLIVSPVVEFAIKYLILYKVCIHIECWRGKIFFKRGQMLMPIYQTPDYIVFKPGTRWPKTGACLVSRNHFCAGCVCVFVWLPPRAQITTNVKWSCSDRLNKFCCFSVFLYCTCYWFYGWAWPY